MCTDSIRMKYAEPVLRCLDNKADGKWSGNAMQMRILVKYWFPWDKMKMKYVSKRPKVNICMDQKALHNFISF